VIARSITETVAMKLITINIGLKKVRPKSILSLLRPFCLEISYFPFIHARH
jgi:hypothetical protein